MQFQVGRHDNNCVAWRCETDTFAVGLFEMLEENSVIDGTFVVVVVCCIRNFTWNVMISSDDSFVDKFNLFFCQTVISQ